MAKQETLYQRTDPRRMVGSRTVQEKAATRPRIGRKFERPMYECHDRISGPIHRRRDDTSTSGDDGANKVKALSRPKEVSCLDKLKCGTVSSSKIVKDGRNLSKTKGLGILVGSERHYRRTTKASRQQNHDDDELAPMQPIEGRVHVFGNADFKGVVLGEIVEYTLSNGTDGMSAFVWCVLHVLKKRDKNISAVSKRYINCTHKFGNEIPRWLPTAWIVTWLSM